MERAALTVKICRRMRVVGEGKRDTAGELSVAERFPLLSQQSRLSRSSRLPLCRGVHSVARLQTAGLFSLFLIVLLLVLSLPGEHESVSCAWEMRGSCPSVLFFFN